MRLLKTLYVSSVLSPVALAFYIPGWSIRSYKDGDPVPLYTNKITSSSTQLSFAYDELDHVCSTKKGGYGESTFGGSREVGLNLGELLRGDRITISDYQLIMGKDVECQHLCTKELDRPHAYAVKQLIETEYVVEWIVDNLPGATAYQIEDDNSEVRFYAPGFQIGYVNEKRRALLYNHVSLVMRWRKAPDNPDRKVIVGFEIYPLSISGPANKCPNSLKNQKPLDLTELPKKPIPVPYTYSVYWKEDNSVEWSRRWDRYFANDGRSERIHWLAIFNCLVVAMLLTGTVGVIMVRTLSRDIRNYNERDSIPLGEGGKRNSQGEREDEDDLMEDITGWKLVHGDVFRPPILGGLYASVVGTGVQLLATCAGLLIFSTIGVLNPSYRGGFMSFALFLFVLSGVFSGYFSSRVYKTFKGEKWLQNALTTAFIFPALLLFILLFLNTLLWAKSSSTALPFTTILAIISMWLLISTPLTIIGAIIGTKKDAISHPATRTTLIPRQIPTQQPWYVRPVPAVLLGGIVPFAVIFIELLYVFKSFVSSNSVGSYYYVYGFLVLIFAILLLTTIEVTIISIYFKLCAEDYNWWWRSFLVGSGGAIWIFGYAIWYAVRYMSIRGFVGTVVFFGYVAMGCLVYASVMGMVGICAGWWFVRKIYGAIKVD